MNEEIMVINEEIENTEVEVVNEEPETSSNGAFGAIAIAGTALIGAAVFALVKTKDKRKAKKIEKLRKEGYVIITPEEAEEIVAESEVCEVEAEDK